MTPAVSDAIFWAAVLLCAVAQFFILRAVFAPTAPAPAGSSAEAGRAAGRLREPSRPLEIAWAVLPAVGLVLVFLWAWQLQHPSAERPVIRTIQVSAA
jgi:heme/copper-type cytochrome/quinol oxidase subunit 2